MGEVSQREFHPIAELFPLMQGTAFDELVADIRKNGLHEPILVDAEGRILDGRNRYRACLAAGAEPRFVEWKGEGELADLAVSLNLRRRHLDESQRAMVGARLAKLIEAGTIQRRGRKPKFAADLQRIPPRRSSAEAAAMVNVSPRLVYRAIQVLREGCPGLIAAVESGELALTPAAVLASNLGRCHQDQIVKAGIKQVLAKARELRGAKNKPAAPRPSPGRYGVLPETAELPPPLARAGIDGVVLFWVDAGAVRDAVAALEARGFQSAG